MNWVLHPEVLSILIATLAMVGVLGLAFAYGVHHRLAWAQLPAAARYAELTTLVMQRETELLDREQRLSRIDDQIRDRETKLLERGQLESEAEYWKSQIEAAKAEYSGLDLLRSEIEEVRERYRQEIETLADAERQVREATGELDDARMRVAEAERRLDQIAGEDGRLRETQKDSVQAVEEMEARLTGKKAELAAEQEALERAQDRVVRTEREVATLESRQEELLAELRQSENVVQTAKSELDGLEPSRRELTKVQESLEAAVRDLKDNRETLNRLNSEEAWLNAQIACKRDEASASTDSAASSLDDLLIPPACLASGGMLAQAQPEEQELEALQRVREHLKESGLSFSERVINAFHTSLKTSVISPLTVLAGVSGTGKSQLPRFYADAMGMHFLKIPVQPRWDGPQDLLGFYNYIEQRYKATDLSRGLIHMDSYNWHEQSEKFRDHVLLVLLDEMNLARVEYYFSEFLSRLEGRPLDDVAGNDDIRRPSEIEIDVSQKGQTRRVYAGQNVLFVGTMNEDESTLSLSDKVLDRANVLRFPRPVKLRSELPTADEQHLADGYLPNRRWTRDWMRSEENMDKAASNRASRIVQDINDIMDDMGRPFGHRMGQAMLHYVANYPFPRGQSSSTEAVELAMSDQVELRILPRLRGVSVEENRTHLNRLSDVVKSLNDRGLAEAIDHAIRRSRDTNGLFVWRGFTREYDTESW